MIMWCKVPIPPSNAMLKVKRTQLEEKDRPLKANNIEKEDTFTFTPEVEWYRADDHERTISEHIACWEGDSVLHCVDAFGASCHVSTAFTQHRMQAEAFDIKLSEKHDITSKSVFLFLDWCLALRPGGIIVGGPPCSMHLFLSSICHLRALQKPEGDTSKMSVRFSNLNTGNYIFTLRPVRLRGVFSLTEQPSSSIMCSEPSAAMPTEANGLQNIMTYLGSHGHALPKSSYRLP